MQGQIYVAGEWRGTMAHQTVNPSDLDETVGVYSEASIADVEDAIASARRALPVWAGQNIQARSDILRTVGDLLLARSRAIGRRILQMAAATMTKVQLELGGKNPFIVLDDADLDIAVDAAAQGSWGQTGQRCTGSERIIVTKGIHDAFVERLVSVARAYKVGHAMDDDTQIGPVANRPQFEKNLAILAQAQSEGAELAAGGDLIEARARGHYMSPALFVGTTNDMKLNRQETFGPIASVIKVENFDEAILVAHDCDLALSSGIATTSLRNAERFRRESRAGLVTVNTPTAGIEYHVPFGGRSPSGYGGREQGTASAEFFTEIKTAYVNHGAP